MNRVYVMSESASLCVPFPVILWRHVLFPVSPFSVSVSFLPVINAHLSHLCLNIYSPCFLPFAARLPHLLPLCPARSFGLCFSSFSSFITLFSSCSVLCFAFVYLLLCVYCLFLLCFFFPATLQCFSVSLPVSFSSIA